MKKVFFAFLITVFLFSCSGSNTGNTNAATKDSVSAAAVSLPYTATYSSNFVPGKQSDVQVTLNNYKAWQDNDMAAMRATMGDSSVLILPSGYTMSGTSDSLVKVAKIYRDSLSKVDITFFAWIPNHSVDKNQDWVSVWYKEVDSHKTGKVDSAIYQDDNRLLDGKIVWSSSHMQKLPK